MKKENFMDNFLSESYKEVEKKINEMNEKLKNLKEFDDEFDFEFDSEAEKAAKKDIEDSEGGFEEIGNNNFEKNINITPEKFKKELGKIDDIEEDDLENIFNSIISKKNHEDRFGKGSLNEDKIRKYIRNILENKFYNKTNSPIEIDEERIANPKSKQHINNLENFIGSHIYGEDLGGLGKMYVAYSYGEQFPVYIHYKNKWYHNTDNYIIDGERVNKATEKHKEQMKPSAQTTGMSLSSMLSMISKFKKENNVGDNNHTDVEPGEKN
jgi:hypothetical protein